MYYPGIPELPRNREFFTALLAMNLRLFLAQTGHALYDFLEAVLILNEGKGFYKRPLFRGDVVKMGCDEFQVLWPPRKVRDD